MSIVSCPVCDEQFQPKKVGQQTCSRPCRSKVRYQRKKADGTGYIPRNGSGPRAASPEHEKSCTECGASFIGAAIQKYCGSKCKARFKERNRIESGYYRRPEVIERRNEIARANYQPRDPKAFEAVPATCDHCGGGFSKTHQHKRYCTDMCVDAARSERTRKPAVVKPCRGCGEEFTATRTMEYCSIACRKKVNRETEKRKRQAIREASPAKPRKAYEPKTHAAICVVCNEMYEARSAKSRYCTEKCRFEERAMREGKRDCRRCSEALEDTHYARYCPPCQVLNRRESSANGRRMARERGEPYAVGRTHRKRAIAYGVPYEPVNRLRIYERDGWKCGICTKKIDRNLKHPHPMAVSLDHIVPISRGGGHLKTNVQAAHWQCNVNKGADATYAQQLLVG